MKDFNLERGIEVGKEIVKSYEDKDGIFSEKVNAEDKVPSEIDERRKTLFMFYVISLDYGMRSEILYNGARKLIEERSEYFEPSFLVEQGKEPLKEVLEGYLSPRYPNVSAERWIDNSQKLLEEFDGDPRKIFRANEDATEVMKVIHDFNGFGKKIGNLFFRAMINLGFGNNLNNIEEITPPIDRHDLNLTYRLGIINEETDDTNYVKKIWKSICKEGNINWLILDKALWLLGSEGCYKDKCKECPVNSYCRNF